MVKDLRENPEALASHDLVASLAGDPEAKNSHPLDDVPDLGLRAAGRENPRGIDRRDEPRREDYRADPSSRRRSESLTRLEKIRVGERVLDQLQFDLDVETVAIGRFNRMIALAVEVGDNGSRQMLEEMLASGRRASGLAREPA